MALTKITNSAIADDIGLGGNPTTSTQTAGNSTTRIATTAFVSTAVANLVGSAPETLNTLAELATSIGNSATLSSTLTTSIATKLPLAGGTLTGNLNLGDNVRARFGTDNDLQIYHDGSHARLRTATGNFNIQTNDFHLTDVSNVAVSFLVDHDGATSIRYNQSEKLATTNTGIDVTGNVTIPTGNKIAFDTDGYTYITEDVDERLRFYVASTEFMRMTNTTTDELRLLPYGGNLFAGGNLDVTGTISSGAITADTGGTTQNALDIGGSSATTYTIQRWLTSAHSGNEAYIIAYGAGHASESGNFGIKNVEASSDIFFELAGSVQPLRLTSTGATFAGSVTATNTILNTGSTTVSTILRGGDGNSKNLVFQKTTGSAQQAKISAVGDDLRFTTGTTTERMRIDSTGIDVTGNIGVSGTVDGIDIAARDAILTSTTTTAGAALPKAGGTMTGALVGTIATFIKNATAGTNALNILGASNGNGTGITFSDNGSPAASASGQNGYFTYYHGDGQSYGSGNAFVLSSSESTTTILADGKLMYTEGLYIKPSSGTGAGTLVIDEGGIITSSRIRTDTTTGLSITADSNNRGILNLSTSQAYQLIGGTHYGYTGYKTGGYHRWLGSDGSEDMRLTSVGLKVGAGNNGPYAPLDVHSSAFGLPPTSGTGFNGMFRIGYYDGRVWDGNEIVMGIINTSAQNYAGYIQSKVPSNGAANRPFLINPQGGNVGIGTDTPDFKLDIEGSGTPTLAVRNSSSSSNSQIHIGEQNTTAYGVDIRYEGNLGNVFFDNHYAHATRPHMYFRMQTAGTAINALTINPVGNVGIGTTTPYAKLHVDGAIMQSPSNSPSVSSGTGNSGIDLYTLHNSYARGSGRLRVAGSENNQNGGYAEYYYTYATSAGGTIAVNLKFINEAYVGNTYARPRLYLLNSSTYNASSSGRQNVNQTASSTNSNILEIGITNVANQAGAFQIVAEPFHWL